MNKTLMVLVLGVSFAAAGCGNQQSQPVSEQPSAMKSLVSQVQTQAKEAQPAVKQLQQDVQQTASDLVDKAQTLLAQAKKYLDEGKLDEAISVAQNVLSIDPKNIDAQKIIEQAKAKLQAMAEQKAGEVKSGVMNTLNTMGQ